MVSKTFPTLLNIIFYLITFKYSLAFLKDLSDDNSADVIKANT